MSTIKHTTSFELSQPVKVVFPLFSAEGETLWIPGWEYENIMGSTDLHEDYVFVTRAHSHAASNAIWMVKRYEPDDYLIQFYKVEPEDKVGIVTVKCRKIDEGLTQAEVSYEYIGLSKKGDEFIEGFTSNIYEAFIREWKDLLVNYFDAKC